MRAVSRQISSVHENSHHTLNGIGVLVTYFGTAAFAPECVKTPSRTLAMISEDFIAGIAHETLYPR